VHVGELDSPGTCTNALSMHGDMLNAPEHRINWKQCSGCQNTSKEIESNLPASAARQAPDESDELRDHADRLSTFMDAQKWLETLEKC